MTRSSHSEPTAVPIIGLIANPHASKDIRRLVSLARVVDVEEKANVIARLLVGMTAGPPVRVVALDDSGGLVRRAARMARGRTPSIEYLPVQAEGRESDTTRAAALLAGMGAASVVTVGGDGTIRSAVEGWPDAVLVPVAAGTNNAVAVAMEPTAVGYAAARAAAGAVPGEAFVRLTTLEVQTGAGTPSMAVVDAVGVRTHWTGARALWEAGDLVEAVVANARPTAIGIAAVAAALGPLPAGHARHIRFGPGPMVRALLGPGLVSDLPVAGHEDLPEGAAVDLAPDTRVVALDGERRLVESAARVRIRPGPRLLSVARALGEGWPAPA